jgi:hypothetical protein
MRGIQIGAVSIATRGRTSVDAWANETGLFLAGVEHGGPVMHNVWAVGARTGTRGQRFAMTLGLGGRIVSKGRLTLDLDALSTWLLHDPGADKTALHAQLRLVLGVRIAGPFGVFAGPTYNVLVTNDPAEGSQAPALDRLLDDGNGWRAFEWVGVTAGVRVR